MTANYTTSSPVNSQTLFCDTNESICMIEDNNSSSLIEYVAGKTFDVFIYNDIVLYLEDNVVNQQHDPDDT